MSIAWVRRCIQVPAALRTGGWPAFCAALALCCGGLLPGAWADGIELAALELSRTEDGLLLDYNARVDLPRAVEDALQKGVPLYFEAEAEVYRPRWYWSNKRVARASRNWRLTWQPLTRTYRVNFGSLSQSYDTLPDALGAVQRAARWKLAEPGVLEDGVRHTLEFSLRLDTSQLPRPLQISFGGQADWELAVERSLAVPEASPR